MLPFWWWFSNDYVKYKYRNIYCYIFWVETADRLGDQRSSSHLGPLSIDHLLCNTHSNNGSDPASCQLFSSPNSWWWCLLTMSTSTGVYLSFNIVQYYGTVKMFLSKTYWAFLNLQFGAKTKSSRSENTSPNVHLYQGITWISFDIAPFPGGLNNDSHNFWFWGKYSSLFVT